jgi:hypothetical protein
MPLQKPEKSERLVERDCVVCGQPADFTAICARCLRTRCNVCLVTPGIGKPQLPTVTTGCGLCGKPTCSYHRSQVSVFGRIVLMCDTCRKG